MSLRASLVISGDASGAEAALASADAAMDRTEAEAAALAAAYARADASIGALAKEQAAANAIIAQAKAAFNAGEIAAEEYNRTLLEARGTVSLYKSQHTEAMGAVKKASAAFDSAANDNAKSAGLAAHHIQNLSFQATDLAVQLASGAPPMMALMQQSGQIAGIMTQAGVGVGGLVKQLGGMAVGFLAANPLLLAATAAAGLFAAGVGLVTAEINKNSDVTVTWQDVLLGAFDVVKEAISSRVSAAFEAMGLDVGEVWKGIVSFTRSAINFIIGASLAVPKTIAATYDKIGPAIGDAFYSGVNLAIRGLNALIDKAAAGVNKVVDLFNSAFGTKIPNVVAGSIAEIANPYAGAMGRLGSAGAQALLGSFTKDYVGDAAGTLSDAVQNRANMREAAKKAGEKVGAAGGKAAGRKMAEETAKTYEELLDDKLASMRQHAQKVIEDLIGDGFEPIKFDDPYQQLADDLKKESDRLAREAENHRQLAIDTANDIADIIGGGVGNAIAEIASALDRFEGLLPQLGEWLGTDASALFDKLGGYSQIGGAVGGGMGGQLGGMAGGMLGEKFLSKGLESVMKGLGDFAGPLGAIAGSILGSVIGGLAKSTPRASATVSIIAGEAMETSITGNKANLKKIAGGMADSLISGLSTIAEKLGGELVGDAKVSVGVRNKNYRVDTTGTGITKTSKGAVDFGEDKAAAIAFALQDAIKDGVLGGLSASLKNLIEADGDLETQLGKALSLKGAFDDLAERTDPLGFALAKLAKDQEALTKILDEAGGTAAEYAKIEELFALKRTDAIKEYDTAAQDAADKAKAIADERYGLETRLLQLQGDTAALRARELEALSPANRELQETIWALERAAEAAEAAAVAERTRADQLAVSTAVTKQVYADRAQMDIKVLELTNNAAGALAASRQLELAAIHPANRALKEYIWTLEDAAVKADKAAKLARDRTGLEADLLEARGDEAGARALRRQLELDALDPELRDLKQQVWAEEDLADRRKALVDASREAAEAEKSRADAIASARQAVAEAFKRESNELQQTIDRLRGVGQSLREFRDGIGLSSEVASLAASRSRFERTSSLAAAGSAAGQSAFANDADAYLKAANDNARSIDEYLAVVATVKAGANAVIETADAGANAAQYQLNTMQQQVGQLAELNERTTSVAEAIARLEALQADGMIPAVTETLAPAIDGMAQASRAVGDQIALLREADKGNAAATVDLLYDLVQLLRAVTDGGAVIVTSEAGQPVWTKVAA